MILTKKYDTETGENLLGVSNYEHNQITPNDTWVINHNMNRYPSVSIVDSAGETCCGDIIYTNSNQIILSFSAAFAGKAYLN